MEFDQVWADVGRIWTKVGQLLADPKWDRYRPDVGIVRPTPGPVSTQGVEAGRITVQHGVPKREANAVTRCSERLRRLGTCGRSECGDKRCVWCSTWRRDFERCALARFGSVCSVRPATPCWGGGIAGAGLLDVAVAVGPLTRSPTLGCLCSRSRSEVGAGVLMALGAPQVWAQRTALHLARARGGGLLSRGVGRATWRHSVVGEVLGRCPQWKAGGVGRGRMRGALGPLGCLPLSTAGSLTSVRRSGAKDIHVAPSRILRTRAHVPLRRARPGWTSPSALPSRPAAAAA